MKHKALKKILAMVLSVSTVFAAIPYTASAEDVSSAASAGPKSVTIKESPLSTGLQNFAINKMYSTGLSICGNTLVRIAGATGNEEFEKTASFINRLVFGGSSTGETLAEIQQLCTEILNEVKIIDEHLKEYDTEIEKSIQEVYYIAAKNTMDNNWERSVTKYEDENYIGSTLETYEEYLKTAKSYADGNTDMAAVETSKDALYKDYREIYRAAGNSFDDETDEEKIRDMIFCHDTVDGAIKRSIQNMANALNNTTNNYVDAAAQYAYTAYAFSGDQYNYITTCIDRQFMEILMLEMMYQEFIAQRGEYFEEKYPDDEKKWDFYSRMNEDLRKLNENVAGQMNTLLDRDIQLKDTTLETVYVNLSDFMRSEDSVTVGLKNENYIENYAYKDDENIVQIIYDDRGNYDSKEVIKEVRLKGVVSDAEATKETVKFDRIAVPVAGSETDSNGKLFGKMDVYYIYHPQQEEGDGWISETSVPDKVKLYKMDYKWDISGGADSHFPSCDFFNLTQGIYTDGNNQFKSISESSQLHSLFDTGVFTAMSSNPSTYLQEYLLSQNGRDGVKTYILLPDYGYDAGTFSWDTRYEVFHLIDTSQSYPGSTIDVTSMKADQIQPGKSNRDHTAYTAILTNQNEENAYMTDLDVAINGKTSVEIGMTAKDGTGCVKQTVAAGTEVELKFKAEDRAVITSISLQRHNNQADPSEVTSEEILLTADEINGLAQNEEGYYEFTYPAPYSNATFVLNCDSGYKVDAEATNQPLENAITLDSYTEYFLSGDTVDFYVPDNVKSVGYYDGDAYKEIQIETTIDGERKGSFVMPSHDVTLRYNALCKEHSYDNGFCTKCGAYQPADYNESTGSYEIGNGGQMFWFAALVNGDGEHTLIQEAKPDVHGVLVSDISLKNPADENYEWKPIGEFKGIFDGQNHTISDFSMTKVNDESIGFFQSLRSDPNETDEAKKATLKNFTLNGTIVTTAEAASAVGGVVGTTSGGVIRRVNSNVNIASGVIYYIGGIVGAINAATSIEESTYSGKIVLDYDFYGVGGIAGFVTDDDTYAGGTKIKDCANYGLITYYKVENHGGRGYSGGITGQVALGEEDFILSDCYNYGSVLAEEWKEIYGAISGYCAAKKDGIKNNYYLDTLPVKGFLGEAEIANDEELAKAKTAEQFKSGEEAYLLNNEVTDGSQVWYQNIDNGETPDAYPVLDDTHGTVYRWEDGTYSNYEKEPVEETYEIRTFEEFKEIPEIVKKNNRANFKLMNTIFGNGETMTESIGSADNPYNGTFDGQGYYVYRFDIKSSDGNAALFDTIGARGSVKNFAAFYQNIEGEKAAGLAIVNYGLIDECISGSNLSGSFSDRLTDEHKDLSETTTFVKGTSMAGGVVVENKGMIRNTANYANATASASDGIVGGIAVVNSGTIENCMSIGSLSTKENGIAGGIVGKLDKNGSIQIAYSAQTAIEGGTTGAVFGTKEESAEVVFSTREAAGEVFDTSGAAGVVKNTYYLDTLSGNEEQGTAKTAAEMKSNAFKEELNTLVAGNEELCSWTWNSTKNQGYPRILSSLITEVELVNASRGLTVRGMMHKDTKLQLNELDKKNNIYQAFKKYAQKTDKQVLYSAEPTLVYEDGQPSAYEGNLNVKLDLSKYRGKGYKVLVYRNNQIEELEIDKQMIASKDVEEMVPFAVLAEKSELSKAVDHIKDTVKTGDNSSVLLLFGIVVVAGIVAGGVIYWRKKKAKK